VEGIYDMVAIGTTHWEVAEYYGLSRSTVSKIITRMNTPSQPVKQGRPVVLRGAGMVALEKYIEKNRFIEMDRMAANFEFQGRKFTKRTLRKRLRELGFGCYTAVQKPFLKEKNIEERKKWAKEFAKWDGSDWAKVIWTDESNFAVRPIKHNRKVWRRPHERYHFSCTVPTLKLAEK